MAMMNPRRFLPGVLAALSGALVPALACAQAVVLESPYGNLGAWWKGQLHAHSSRSDGHLSPREVVERYRAAGYAFVSLTDHRNIRKRWFDGPTSCDLARRNPAPDLPITVIPGLELGQPPHFAYVGLPDQGKCHPRGARLPEDVGELVCWIAERGGLAIAAHPMFGEQRAARHRKRRWGAERLREHAAPRGCLAAMEIVSPADLEMWDALLREGRRVWGVMTDDSHRGEGIDGRGFVVVNGEPGAAVPGRETVLANLLAGNFYAVRHGYRGRRLDPPSSLRVDVGPDGAGRWTVRASVAGADSYRCVYGTRPAAVYPVCRRELSRPCVEEAVADGGATVEGVMGCLRPVCEATCPPSGGLDGSEGYVRIELENAEGAIAYSQPLRVMRATDPAAGD